MSCCFVGKNTIVVRWSKCLNERKCEAKEDGRGANHYSVGEGNNE